MNLPAKAATVTSTADDGPGSLREAIANAASGETISFSVTGTITLTSGELLITNDLTILGPGASGLTIQRSTETNTPDFRILHVRSGEVTISGLSLSNGREVTGGAINNDTTLTLTDCIIGRNSATRYGGGINNAGTLTMSNCVIWGNFFTDEVSGFYGGGGIFNWGTLTAVSCTIRDNRSSGWGGGIYNNDWGTLTITNSGIIGNFAAGTNGGNWGGGILNDGSLVIDTSTIASNSTTAGGGGIANGLGTLSLIRSTVSSNSAQFGAGIINENLAIVENSTISGNLASSGVGGGVETRPYSATSLDQSTVTANVGGGSYNFVG